MEKIRRGGRPRHGEEVKTAPLSMRIDPNLRLALEEAKDASGRSLTQEVELRLAASFDSAERKLIDPELWGRLLHVTGGRDVAHELNERLRITLDDEFVRLPWSECEALRVAAQARKHSLQAEVVDRLKHSLMTDNFFGSSNLAGMLRYVGTAIDLVERQTGGKWTEDPSTFAAARHAVEEVMALFRPAKPDVPDIEKLEEEVFELMVQFRYLRAREQRHLEEHPEMLAYRNLYEAVRRGDKPKADLDVAARAVPREHWRDQVALAQEVARMGDALMNKMEERDRLLAPQRREAQRVRGIGKLNALVAAGKMTRDEAETSLAQLEEELESSNMSRSPWQVPAALLGSMTLTPAEEDENGR